MPDIVILFVHVIVTTVAGASRGRDEFRSDRIFWKDRFTRNPMFARLRGDMRFKQVLESIAFRRQKTNR